MSNVSIFEKKWIDLVFQGKNQEYGAYQLRKEHPKTTLKALFFALFTISGFFGIGFILSSFDSKSNDNLPPILDEVVKVSVFNVPPIEKESKKIESKAQSKPKEVIENNKTLVVAKQNQEYEDVAKNNEIPKSNPSSDETGQGTNSNSNQVSSGGTAVIVETPITPDKPVGTAILDELPEFPGGIKKFYNYIGNNFEKKEIEGHEKLTVHVSFVIEKDGSMTDITVLRNPGFGLDKEAIRVLKSLKTKWKPGVLNGQKVRTQYTLPITIVVNQ